MKLHYSLSHCSRQTKSSFISFVQWAVKFFLTPSVADSFLYNNTVVLCSFLYNCTVFCTIHGSISSVPSRPCYQDRWKIHFHLFSFVCVHYWDRTVDTEFLSKGYLKYNGSTTSFIKNSNINLLPSYFLCSEKSPCVY